MLKTCWEQKHVENKNMLKIKRCWKYVEKVLKIKICWKYVKDKKHVEKMLKLCRNHVKNMLKIC